jgi:hypothetical protein
VLLRCHSDCLRYVPPRKGSSASVSFTVTESLYARRSTPLFPPQPEAFPAAGLSKREPVLRHLSR